MNLFVKGAFAIAATATVGFAGPTDSNDWLELDSEINNLASSYASSQGDGMGWSGLLRYTYTFSSDDIATGSGGDDISGFNFEDVDLAFWGGVGIYQWRISFDLDGNNTQYVGGSGSTSVASELNIEDAYVSFETDEYFTTTVGYYKMHVLLSNSVDPEDQLFIDRSALGSAFDFWDGGIAINGSQDMLNWWAGLSNGSNSDQSGHTYFVRGEYNFGTGAGNAEGALGANDELNGTIGATFFDDDVATGDAMMFAIDGRGTMGPIGVGGEVAFLDENLTSTLWTSGDYGNISPDPGGSHPDGRLSFADNDDTTPFGVWASYLLNDEFEGAVRYDDLDNALNESVVSVVVNWYRSGSNAKWQAQWSDVDSDGEDGSTFQVGIVVGSTR